MSKFIKIVLFVLSIFYPFVLIFSNKFSASILFCLSIFWIIRAKFEKTQMAFFCLILGIFMMCAFIFNSSNLKFYYPIFVSLLMLFIFGFSLKNEAIITKIAKFKEPNLDDFGIKYTRNLTKIWCYFFIFNTFITYILSTFEDKKFWALYCGLISYILMGILFSTEFLYRKLILKR